MNENNNQFKALPILYSLRNCPYAMRARIALFKSKQPVLLRDLVLSDKPAEMIEASPKATVPVLVLATGEVIDESLDVMLWALKESDPNDLLHSEDELIHPDENMLSAMLAFIDEFDNGFKSALEQYKCAKRYQEDDIVQRRAVCQQYLDKVEQRLTTHKFLFSDQESLADIAILPFLRQFARVERQWYLQSPYPKLKQWLNGYLQSPMFTKVMAKYPLWQENHEPVLFGDIS